MALPCPHLGTGHSAVFWVCKYLRVSSNVYVPFFVTGARPIHDPSLTFCRFLEKLATLFQKTRHPIPLFLFFQRARGFLCFFCTFFAETRSPRAFCVLEMICNRANLLGCPVLTSLCCYSLLSYERAKRKSKQSYHMN